MLKSLFHRLDSHRLDSQGIRADRRQAIGRACCEPLESRRLLSFTAAASFPVGPNPQAVATADLNEDGRLDLVTSNVTDNTISVRLGNGAGGFGAAASHFDVPYWFNPGAEGATLAIADFTGDGDLDVVTVQHYYGYGVVSLLRGNGDGTLGQAIDMGGAASAAVAGDFNADTTSDFVVSWYDYYAFNALVQVCLSDGHSGFTYPTPYKLADGLETDLAVGDINGDGKLDAVLVIAGSSNGWALIGNGDGTFLQPDPWYPWPGYEFSVGPGASDVALGDFTGDGKLDAVVAGLDVNVMPGRGDGTFGPPISHSASGNVHTAVAVADFDGDGKLDVVSTSGTGSVNLLLGSGDGSLRLAGTFAVGAWPAAVTVGDFNADGRPDVATADGDPGTVSVLLNEGGWSAAPNLPWLRIGDVTVVEGNAGTTDGRFVVTLSAASDRDVTFRYATADGTATAGVDYAAASGLVTIPAGQTSATIAVPVHGDRTVEFYELFSVVLAEPTDAVIADGWAFATIVDDERSISVGDVRLTEGNSGVTYATFTVSLSLAYDEPVSVDFATADGTATAGSDYQATAGTLTFAAGETTKTVRIAVFGDTLIEVDEYFSLILSGPSGNAFLSDGWGYGTIVNDDFPTPRKRGKNK